MEKDISNKKRKFEEITISEKAVSEHASSKIEHTKLLKDLNFKFDKTGENLVFHCRYPNPKTTEKNWEKHPEYRGTSIICQEFPSSGMYGNDDSVTKHYSWNNCGYLDKTQEYFFESTLGQREIIKDKNFIELLRQNSKTKNEKHDLLEKGYESYGNKDYMELLVQCFAFNPEKNILIVCTNNMVLINRKINNLWNLIRTIYIESSRGVKVFSKIAFNRESTHFLLMHEQSEATKVFFLKDEGPTSPFNPNSLVWQQYIKKLSENH